MIQRRADLLKQLRAFFDSRSFIEVETPLLSRDTVVDRHIDPIEIVVNGQSMWLQTSPEFAMKRLVASGAQAIYQITRAFRQGERGAQHNPEFTMLEWYRVGDDFQRGMQLLSELAIELFDVVAVGSITYQAAFTRFVGIDPLAATTDELATICRSRVPTTPDFGDDRDAWLNMMLSALVEPNLGTDTPTILFHYPASQAALATISPTDPRVCERFELYFRGVELANAYHELCDADELARRNKTANDRRVSDGKSRLPEASRLLAAMQRGLPPCSGAALGVDRLLMLLCDRDSIDEVIAFPIERA